MPVLVRGGGNGKKIKDSLILADNVKDLKIISGTDSMKLSWSIPESEIEIKNFNIYLKKTDEIPTDLSQFEKVATVDATKTEYTINGLESGFRYYIVVESVSVEDYENASLRGVKESYARKGYWITVSVESNNHVFYFSDDGEKWKYLTDSNGEKVEFAYYDSYFGKMLSVDGRMYYQLREWSSESCKIFYLNTDTGESINTMFYSGSEFKNNECFLHTGKRFVASANTGNSCSYWYCIGYPEETKDWVAMGKGSYAFEGAAHNDLIVTAQYQALWGYYDFNNEEQWKYIGGSLQPDIYTSEKVCYGNNLYVFVAAYGTSIYVKEENIKKGQYVYISKGTSTSDAESDFTDVIYAKKENRFFAINASGETFYMDANGSLAWKKMNGTIERGNLSYGNGRLICRGLSTKAWYCIDGMNWVAMNGITQNPKNQFFDVCSLYD